MRKLLILATFVFLFATVQTASAQNWEKLGEETIKGDDSDHDNVKVGHREGTFRALRFRVENAAIDFQYVVVHYDNGNDDRLPLRGRVPAGGNSGTIDLKGGNRVIKSVDVWYTKAKWGKDKKPRMILYGRK